ncbi:MAG: type II secretion system minor pseudopilin GspJ [Gammaproteobacteria bacterium]|nr:type II secretion system minor pseudopilin GspJ [Gammaproteobacteria bacterium]
MGRTRGFTLLEMVIAMALFAVVAAISYASLIRFLETRDQLSLKNEELRSLQRAFDLLARDLRYLTSRPVRDGFGDVESMLIAMPDNPPEVGERIRLTTTQPLTGLTSVQRATRVAWRLEDGDLLRIAWQVLDRDQDSVEQSRLVLEDVADMSLLFFSLTADQQLESTAEWDDPDALPRGVEITVVLSDERQYQRLFEVPDGV